MAGVTPSDHKLIERVRKLNKTLSMFIFVVQEGGKIPADSQSGIADLLVELAGSIRARAAAQDAVADEGSVVFDGTVVAWLTAELSQRPIPAREPRAAPGGCGE